MFFRKLKSVVVILVMKPILGSSNSMIIRVPFFVMFSFNKETPKSKGKKGTTGVPRIIRCSFWKMRSTKETKLLIFIATITSPT